MNSSKYFHKPYTVLDTVLQQTSGFSPCDLGPLDYPQKILSTDEFLPCIIQFFKEFFILLVDQIDITRNTFSLLVFVFLSLSIAIFDKLLPRVLTTKLPLNSSYKYGSLTGRSFKSCMNTETHRE